MDKKVTKIKLSWIKAIYKKRGFVLTGHARKRMRERNISINDIKNVILNGKRTCKHRVINGDMACKVEGTRVDGSYAALGIALGKNQNNKDILIITTVMDWDRD